MASHLAVVSGKMRKGGKASKKHAHPVKHMSITPTDNGGFVTEHTMHPPESKGSQDMYQPGETMTAAHPNVAQMLKHVKGVMALKNDEQEGNGMTDPGSAEDVEDKA